MTLKQKMFAKEIRNPENHLNISKTMRKVGYTEGTSRAGSQYNRLRKITNDIFSPDKTKRKILKHQKLCLKKDDLTNAARMIELEARISVPELRKQEITTDQPREITINYGAQPKEVLQPIISDAVKDNVTSNSDGKAS